MTVQLTSIPSSIPVQTRSTPTASSLRSPKRVKQTPTYSAGSSSSSTPNTTYNKPPRNRAIFTVPKRIIVEEDRQQPTYYATSPCRSSEENWSNPGRRREMSVPLLSQTLSDFSLSQQSPPYDNPRHTLNKSTPPTMSVNSRQTTSSRPWKTPTKSYNALPRDQVYPSTAPLPQLPTFLGSPFSSRTTRKPYESPSKMIVCNTTCTQHEDIDYWMRGTEWIEDRQTALDDHESEPGPIGRVSISSSSADECSTSGTSCRSLQSLSRSSDDHARVIIWNEEVEDSIQVPFTPSKTLSEVNIQIQTRTRSSNEKGSRTPLKLIPSRTSSISSDKTQMLSPSPAKPRSPLASLIPRLLSSTQRSMHRLGKSKSPKENTSLGEDMTTDTEDDVISIALDSHKSAPKTHLEGLGLGLGSSHLIPETAAAKSATPLIVNNSFSSESSIECESPSKRSSIKSSTQKQSVPAPSSPSPAEPRLIRKIPSVHLRRKTMVTLVTQKSSQTPTSHLNARPTLRRGVTDPSAMPPSQSTSFSTPPASLFSDERPSPAAFASTGLVKKRGGSNGVEKPRFGTGSRLPSGCSTEIESPIALPTGQSANLIDVDARSIPRVSISMPKSRGLRRKGSTVFSGSGSSGSIGESMGDNSGSPATPTKAGYNALFGVTTPSPTSPVYPFSTASSVKTPPKAGGRSRSSIDKTTIPMRLRQMSDQRQPVARASNPMLAASFRIQGMNKTTSQSAASVGPGPNEANNLERFEKEFFIVSSLGSGAFSKVWKVRDKRSTKLWAVKAGKPYTGYKDRLRHLEEASILRLLSLDPDHQSHIIHFVDAWETSSRLYIRTTLSECGDFGVFLDGLGDFGGLEESRVWKVMHELSEGLRWIHSKGVLHLDLKPSNVMIGLDGGLRIGDFGLSRLSDSEGMAVEGLSPVVPTGSGIDGLLVWTEAESRDDMREEDHSHGGLSAESRSGFGFESGSGSGSGWRGMISGVPSPILEREHEGDREYLCPEALRDRIVGRGADVFSLGILLLEAALNVVLPSNGDGWVKLRNDDFSDTIEHYLPRLRSRSQSSGSSGSSPSAIDHNDVKPNDYTSNDKNNKPEIPVLSDLLVETIKKMMASDPKERVTLDQVLDMDVMRRLASVKIEREGQRLGDCGNCLSGEERRRTCGPALVEEVGDWFLPFIFGEAW